ncbi:MAG: ribulose-phosphate 3-epimerase [Prevotellaceae bacterium]|jgi:ribulose-phosphate 3-epimerase|nr:ribulose-phosphate 3-epimerase [Prevotellaceae bacterium]
MLSVSMLSADFGRLNEEIEKVNSSAADWFHLDIMDGLFVPNLSFGFPVVKIIAAKAKKPLDVHLMIEHPEKYIDAFHAAGAHYLSVHYEACRHLHRTLQHIRATGMKAGVALNPHTPVSLLEDIMHETDFVLLMSVNPGFGGQALIPHSLQKIKALKELIRNEKAAALIEVDGGINLLNAAQLYAAGADILVAGHAVFSSPAPQETIEKLKSYNLALL